MANLKVLFFPVRPDPVTLPIYGEKCKNLYTTHNLENKIHEETKLTAQCAGYDFNSCDHRKNLSRFVLFATCPTKNFIRKDKCFQHCSPCLHDMSKRFLPWHVDNSSQKYFNRPLLNRMPILIRACVDFVSTRLASGLKEKSRHSFNQSHA